LITNELLVPPAPWDSVGQASKNKANPSVHNICVSHAVCGTRWDRKKVKEGKSERVKVRFAYSAYSASCLCELCVKPILNISQRRFNAEPAEGDAEPAEGDAEHAEEG
jgi:hypothetical protein